VDDSKAVEELTREMELTRLEMAALTDSMVASRHVMESLTKETARLAALIETAQSRGFWRRLMG
jgi:hypothetical protein